jgi:hypothetical protein
MHLRKEWTSEAIKCIHVQGYIPAHFNPVFYTFIVNVCGVGMVKKTQIS